MLNGMKGRDLAILGAAWLVTHLPFMGQALIIDDGTFVDQALQILKNPAAPYSFDLHLAVATDFFEYSANPPGLAYWLAAAIALFGRSEFALHAAMLPWSGLYVLATYGLARQFHLRPLWAALLVLVTPAFLMSSHGVMTDVPAAAMYVTAVWLYVRGVDTGRAAPLLGAGVAAGLAALLKYSALTSLPLLLLYAILRRRVRTATIWPLVVSAAIFGAWCLASWSMYGRVHAVTSYAFESIPTTALARLVQAVAALIGLGGTTIFAPILLTWAIAATFRLSRASGVCGVVIALCAFAAALPEYSLPILTYDLPNRLLGGLLFAAGAATAVYIILLGAVALRRWLRAESDVESRDAAGLILLVVWLLGLMAIDSLALFATPRYLVPALPALVLLLLEGTNRRRAGPPAAGPILGTITLVSTAALALALSIVGAAQVQSHREFVTETIPKLAGGHDVWFTGHWTLRYYAEHAGQRHLGAQLEQDAVPKQGDVVYIIFDAAWHTIPPFVAKRLLLADVNHPPGPLPLHVANQLVRGSYWAHVLGIMPYVISTEPMSVQHAYRVGRP